MADAASDSETTVSSNGAAEMPPVLPESSDGQIPPITSSSSKRPGFWNRLGDGLSWTAPQRQAMVVLLGVVLAILLWRAVRDRAYVSDPQPAVPARFHELADRLDPNTAGWEELVALPQLGEKRAKGIVEHREEWKRWHPNEPAYKEPLDLVAVKGIGGAMVETLTPYLHFGATTVSASPETQPGRSDANLTAPRKSR